jgi:SAM-dependent methyltransferase
MNKDFLQAEIDAIATQHGDWLTDFPLPHGVWTAGNRNTPHTRLKRIAQVIADVVPRPLAECRILDLGCLEGQFAIEMALQGASAVGIEIRASNIEKGKLVQRALGLEKLVFHQDDVRNISVEKYGRFDAIICSGILYHLPAADAIRLIGSMHEMATCAVILDTHIALAPKAEYRDGEVSRQGKDFVEHAETATSDEKERARYASADNLKSFWFTRPSLVNILADAGFTSVYECFTPIHKNFGRPGIEAADRCTFVAIKGEAVDLVTSPAANRLKESWPEKTLNYAPRRRSLYAWARSASGRLVRGGR